MSDATLSIDWETFSECDLRSAGSFAYAAHPSTDILCAAFAFGEEEPSLWLPGQPCPPRIVAHVGAGGQLHAWNANFERVIWQHVATPKYGWPVVADTQWHCTAAQAANMGLPRDLDGAASALGGGHQKDPAGKRVMMQLSRPRFVHQPDHPNYASALQLVGFDAARRLKEDGALVVRWSPADAPEKFATLYEYCRQDVRAERDISSRLLSLSAKEREIYLLDAKINSRGIKIDRPLIEAAQKVVASEMQRLDADMHRVTGGAVTSCTQAARLCKWLQVDSVAAHLIDELLAGDLAPEHRAALGLRREAAKSSNAKLDAMLAAAGPDDRVRGALLYAGTVPTSRWAGRLVQPQNMPQGNLAKEDVSVAISLIQAGDIEGMRLLFSSPLDAISSCLRGCLIAGEGNDLIASDFTSVEARALAWLAGEEAILKVFVGHGKIYEHAASGIYGVPIDKVTKPQRQLGKTAVLACGYGGWTGAFLKMAEKFNIEISDEEAAKIAGAWRESNPLIVKFWRDCNDAAFRAVARPGTKQPVRGVVYLCTGPMLWCRLPSGRAMPYPRPSIKKNGRGQDAVHYWGQDQLTRKWTEFGAYGGMLVNHITQGFCRDLMAYAMIRLEAAGYPIICTVHDEIVAEVPKGFGSVEELESIMSEVPDWALGMPIAVDGGYRSTRYRK